MVFFNSDKISSFEGKFLVGALRGQHLIVVNVAEDGSLISTEKMFEGDFGRIRTAQIGPDGVLYLLTANGDNDKIIRISEAPLDDVEKFTSNESDSNQTIFYVIIGIIITVAAAGVIVIKRKR
jgi:LPXTG-motif cell wall-anchored protein